MSEIFKKINGLEINKALKILLLVVTGVVIIPISLALSIWSGLKRLAPVIRKAICFMDNITVKHPRTRYCYLLIGALTVCLAYGLGGLVENTKSATTAKEYIEATNKNINGETLQGIDISSWQADNWSELIEYADDFVIVRAICNNEVDSLCDKAIQKAIRKNKLTGVYFYTDEKLRKAKEEEAKKYARWCAKHIEGYVGYSTFWLDFENTPEAGTNYDPNPDWALEFCKEFKKVTGVRPGLYMNANCAQVNDWPEELYRYPLWIADYDNSVPTTAGWDVYYIHQFTSNDDKLDEDRFYGSAADWWQLAEVVS